MIRRPPRSTLFPTRRSSDLRPCGFCVLTCIFPGFFAVRLWVFPIPHLLLRAYPACIQFVVIALLRCDTCFAFTPQAILAGSAPEILSAIFLLPAERALLE